MTGCAGASQGSIKNNLSIISSSKNYEIEEKKRYIKSFFNDNLTTQETSEFQQSLEKITVKYIIPGTDIEAEREIFISKNLNCDIKSWAEEFRKTISVCNLKKDTSLAVLQSVLPLTILEQLKDRHTVDTRLDALSKIKYPVHQVRELKEKLKGIKQSHFLRIADFARILEKK
ncbi:hypothetical protein DMUE_4847 [Dictyocoela muelleri]|nr:hypothetical protein DMUE_4847 [Dictyocoela muelleri]